MGSGFGVVMGSGLERLYMLARKYGGFPKIRGTLLGVLILRIIVFWALYWGPLNLGNDLMTSE